MMRRRGRIRELGGCPRGWTWREEEEEVGEEDTTPIGRRSVQQVFSGRAASAAGRRYDFDVMGTLVKYQVDFYTRPKHGSSRNFILETSLSM